MPKSPTSEGAPAPSRTRKKAAPASLVTEAVQASSVAPDEVAPATVEAVAVPVDAPAAVQAPAPRRVVSLHLAPVTEAPEPPPPMTPAMAVRERARLENLAVQEMNATTACVLLEGQAFVLLEDGDGGHTLATFRSMADWMASNPLRVPVVNDRTGAVETKRTCRATLWRGHENRRNVRRIEFAPCQDLGPSVYNTWRGWGVDPLHDDGAAAAPILRHIREVWCGGDATLGHWVLSWIAHMLQRPCEKPGTALVLRGEEGVGKGVIAGVLMRRLMGPAFVQILHPGQVTGRFNALWQSKLCVFADEAFWAGDKPSEGILKGLITEPRMVIEHKGKNAFELANHAHPIFATNNEWAVPAGRGARRFCVMDVLATYKGDNAYHGQLRAAVDGDGAASFLAYMMAYDVAGVDLRRPPVTAALLDQKVYSLDSVPRWWKERLWSGFIDDPDHTLPVSVDEGDGWSDTVGCKRLFGSYAAFCKRMGVRYPEGEESFAKKLREIAPMERKRGSKDHRGGRPWVYQFGTDNVSTLHHLRGVFEKWIGGALDWTGDEPRRDDGDDEPRDTRPHPPGTPSSHLRDEDVPW